MFASRRRPCPPPRRSQVYVLHVAHDCKLIAADVELAVLPLSREGYTSISVTVVDDLFGSGNGRLRAFPTCSGIGKITCLMAVARRKLSLSPHRLLRRPPVLAHNQLLWVVGAAHSAMSTREVLQKKYQELAELYDDNLATAHSLQHTLEEDILPGLVDELGLDGESEQRARLWLTDTRTSRLNIVCSRRAYDTALVPHIRVCLQATTGTLATSTSSRSHQC